MTTGCEHHNWRVLYSNRVGCATCLDCKKEIGLPEAFNILADCIRKQIKERD